MGCSSPSKGTSWVGSVAGGKSSAKMPGDNVNCFMKRNDKDTGDQQGSGQEAENQIIPVQIIPDCDMKVDITFKVTGPRVPTSWYRHTNQGGDGVADPAPGIGTVTFSQTGTTATFKGQFDPQHTGKKFEFYITAKDADGVIDSNHYIVSPQKCDKSNSVVFTHPMPGAYVSSGFGPRTCPGKCSNPHRGLDFSTGQGSKNNNILASADGTVIFAGMRGSYGNLVIIEHKDGSGKKIGETRYGHMNAIYVSVGQQVAAGTKIGLEGTTGNTYGKHLHFELRLGSGASDSTTPVNPTEYIRGGTTQKGGAIVNPKGSNNPDAQAADPSKPTGPETTSQQPNTAATSAQAKYIGDCPPEPIVTPNQDVNPAPVGNWQPKLTGLKFPCSSCRQSPDPLYPTLNSIVTELNRVWDILGLDAWTKSFFGYMIQIESGYNRFAKSNTGAMGLYQFVPGNQRKFFAGGAFCPPQLKNVQPTCENLANIEYSTYAMVAFWNHDYLKSWNEWSKSNKTKLNNFSVNTSDPRIQNLISCNKMTFMYAIHHDGAPAVSKGKQDGINIFRTAAKQYGFAMD